MSLELMGLTKRFGDVVAVDDVSLTLAEGETVALLGPSGCGKSTLLRLVAGLERPDSGRLRLAGADVTDVPPQRRDVGMVFQSFALFPHLDVAGNVAFGLVEAGMPAAQRAERVGHLLELVGLAGLGARRVDRLSGGQQQRVALARALAPDPALLLLDEPLSNLDEQLRQALKGELARLLGALGKRALYVTHDQSEAFALADRVALMRAGRIVQLGPSEELLERPVDGWAARFLGHENVFEAAPRSVLPTGAEGLEALFRADLAALLPADEEHSAGGHAHTAEAVVIEALREGLGWRLVLDVPKWGVQVVWRGFDREVRAALGLAVPPGAPRPGASLVLSAPPDAWRLLDGQRPAAQDRAARSEGDDPK
ncbi:MAG: ABC transporter ATP-binding protein, partial [Trueperaceae bacterium]